MEHEAYQRFLAGEAGHVPDADEVAGVEAEIVAV